MIVRPTFSQNNIIKLSLESTYNNNWTQINSKMTSNVISQHQQQSTTVSSSSSSALTNSYASPSSSLTSIPTNSPTSTHFSSNPVSDPISVCDSVVAADDFKESDKNDAIINNTEADYLQEVGQEEEASSMECQHAGDMVPASLISQQHTQEIPSDAILCFSSDPGGLVDAAAISEQQQELNALVAVDREEEEEAKSYLETVDVAASMAEASALRNDDDEEDTDTYISRFDEQQQQQQQQLQPLAFSGPECDDSGLIDMARLERSNSCSQADAVAHSIEQQQQLLASEALAKCSLVGPTSISHENLTGASQATATTIVYDHATSFIPPTLDTPDTYLRAHESSPAVVFKQQQQPAKNETDHREAQQQLVNLSAQQSISSGTSRFFSSKLNTGSLWSLLSVGSNHSSASNSNANESATMTTTIDNKSHDTSSPGGGGSSKHETDKLHQQQQAAAAAQDKNLKSSLSAGFFNRVQQFKRQHSNQEVTNSQRPPASLSSSIDDSSSLFSRADVSNDRADSKRFRFHVKYIGSSMLHKNFTLPMLEWIARDIKRQTVRGAQSTNQRQFTIPARDIILEIQSYQLMGTSCKDGHCIFVHPMHCVSKYAQLQHDPDCFSYLIRDTKESPYFCHVFQAKSTHKVHEIFSAIREATTTQTPLVARPKLPSQVSVERGLCTPGAKVDAVPNSRIQKSASSDGQTRNIFGHSVQGKDSRLTSVGSPPTLLGTPQSYIMSNSSPMFSISATATARAREEENQAENAQFENNYQFEVMFVKKVKLQCRRVPASFVDDALETLKSFDVLKGNDSKAQIKGIGKRIISASVDERQEYDEMCQSPTPTTGQHPDKPAQSTANSMVADSLEADQRRGSSASLNRNYSTIKEERESRSCQQSPAKLSSGSNESHPTSNSDMNSSVATMKHHQSMSCLDNLDSKIRSAKAGDTPHYFNDFSPYNTITSNDLNERIAAIPVVSSSVSLDHETRQRLARQVRETIMATAANIKKDVYAASDKLDTSSSFKVLDSLSCTAISSVPSMDDNETPGGAAQSAHGDKMPSSQIPTKCSSLSDNTADQRRSSAAGPFFQPNAQTTNNFDLFRRASARQVVKNRTMLLLIGKDELCTISIDKHQVLFSKSFSSIVHCLQGNNNRDHFGLICRDSGKINPNTESYVGLIFKCQSEKVVREIMGALKQVIYNSQHNYHGYNSIYNPINATKLQPVSTQNSDKLQRAHTTTSPSSRPKTGAQTSTINANKTPVDEITTKSLAAKRGFSNHLELDSSANTTSFSHQQSMDRATIGTAPPTTSSVLTKLSTSAAAVSKAPKNLIKSMFCDNCPLYWYHRLCCDVESLPAEACKAIILRRVDSSLAGREQDELYSKFSDFNIESIDEHNEIFMSLLRHTCERNQLKHNQTQAHQAAIAKNNPSLVKQSTLPTRVSRQSSTQTPTSGGITSAIISNSSSLANAFSRSSTNSTATSTNAGGHQRSGSSGGSLGIVLGQSVNTPSISDAGSLAMDNLKRAKNNLSVSIENMLKRRASIKDDADDQEHESRTGHLPARSGSFRSATRESRTTNQGIDDGGSLKRSSSTSDYPSAGQLNQPLNSVVSWRDSFSRTINDDLTNPLMGLFRRRSSTFGAKDSEDDTNKNRASTDELNRAESLHHVTPQHQPASPSTSESRFNLGSTPNQVNGGSSPSSMLSGAFWKKSIFDKIRQPQTDETSGEVDGSTADPVKESTARRQPMRSREELRSLWRKAILEQITLIKMDRQNQRLLADSSTEHDIQRIKLNYEDVPYKRNALSTWDRLLKQDPTKKVQYVEVARLVRYGVPKQRRGEIWMFLMNQYQLRHGTSFQPIDSEYRGDANQTYRSLLSELSTQQHEIFVDIGRTFPAHPYYSQYLSIGQLSLFNLLKAYSLLDQEVGYCQGLSFVAGILLLHVDSEDEAFELMRHLLFNFGLRKQYLPSMNALHLQLYQITRLLRDHEYELFNHFDCYDISPSLYAAPWFLTLFASQFPLGFVARLLDLIYLMGIEAIFRVSLNLLAYHRAAILERKSLESTMDFMRSGLVKIDDKNLAMIFDKSMSIDLRNELIEYEIEYTFYCAEDKTKSIPRYHMPQNTSSDTRGQSRSDPKEDQSDTKESESTAKVADATATVIIQHLLANNHLKSLQSNYSY